jgi:hypothetical protein
MEMEEPGGCVRREVVKSLFRLAMRIDSLEEFEAKLKIAMN